MQHCRAVILSLVFLAIWATAVASGAFDPQTDVSSGTLSLWLDAADADTLSHDAQGWVRWCFLFLGPSPQTPALLTSPFKIHAYSPDIGFNRRLKNGYTVLKPEKENSIPLRFLTSSLRHCKKCGDKSPHTLFRKCRMCG